MDEYSLTDIGVELKYNEQPYVAREHFLLVLLLVLPWGPTHGSRFCSPYVRVWKLTGLQHHSLKPWLRPVNCAFLECLVLFVFDMHFLSNAKDFS